ncbi:hypothetical protein FACS1894111_04830 [Clostridia bacterium]|nr:hypothetical protein FACS1894111_04830 [Clostridia bacterium]
MEAKWSFAPKSAYYNIKTRLCSFRFLTVLLMLLAIFDMYLRDFRENAQMMELRANLAIFPFLQADGYFMKVLMLGVIYFYSNVPFREQNRLFALNRLGKPRWGRQNIAYIIGSGLILTLVLAVLSILLVLPVGTFSLSWDAVYKTLALTGGNRQLLFHINYHIMRAYPPAVLMSVSLLLDWIVISFVGMAMYTVSLFGSRTMSCVVGAVFAFLPSIGNWVPISLYFSPTAWLDCDNWRIGADSTKPDLAYMIVLGLFLNFLLILLSQARVRKMEWRAMEE